MLGKPLKLHLLLLISLLGRAAAAPSSSYDLVSNVGEEKIEDGMVKDEGEDHDDVEEEDANHELMALREKVGRTNDLLQCYLFGLKENGKSKRPCLVWGDRHNVEYHTRHRLESHILENRNILGTISN